jgi:anthranilate synthase/phosphoribosyltransferase
MLLLIDNYDSFTYNLFQYLSELGEKVEVLRNDKVSIEDIERMSPDRIVISPGPSTPLQAGVCNDVIRHFGPKLPILGVCLGHQCIGYSYGGSFGQADQIMHGKSSDIHHSHKGVFSGLPNPLTAIRYHSLVVQRDTLPDCLEVTAWTEDGTIMGLKHRLYPVEGIQFHPESFMTQSGKELLQNFLRLKRVNILKDAISSLTSGQSLSIEQAELAMEQIMSGNATPAQVAAFITALRVKGETADEIIGMAKAMRAKALPITTNELVVDTCGTGGDNSGTFNISTAAAIVAAAAGLKIAKHGNRAAGSRCGSADVLEALNVRIDLNPQQVQKCIEKIGIGFIFAPAFHPALKHVASARREIGIRTIFNLLGPLCNPAGARVQVMGVADGSLLERMALVLQYLGCQHAIVVHGEDGLDEITITGVTKVCELRNNHINTYSVNPHDFGLSTANLNSIKGGDAQENAGILRNILAGERGPKRDVVLMNTAAVLMAADKIKTLQHGVALAEEAIDSGRAMNTLDQLIKFSQDAEKDDNTQPDSIK